MFILYQNSVKFEIIHVVLSDFLKVVPNVHSYLQFPNAKGWNGHFLALLIEKRYYNFTSIKLEM